MPDVHETKLSLRFFGDDLNPDEITAGLGMEPKTAVRKGGTWHTPNGKPQVARTGRWLFEVAPRKPGDLDGQVRELFDSMSGDLDLWRDFARRYNGNLFAGLWIAEANEGTTFASDTLLAIGSRGLEIGLDIYPIYDAVQDEESPLL